MSAKFITVLEPAPTTVLSHALVLNATKDRVPLHPVRHSDRKVEIEPIYVIASVVEIIDVKVNLKLNLIIA